MIVRFEGDVYRWEARTDSDWYFVALPPELSDDIRETQTFRRGFGGVRVDATIGGSVFRTSIFPQAGGVYVLPLKRAVRDAEGISPGDIVVVDLLVLDA
ncbi:MULTISPECIES: DUF1905 domain-containing protein [Microbacterium]|uniref:DUF1905 domain-containing protein n=1 Tax=Microbacterium testaceum TaxID=2033 RepID=A0A147F9J7_MICTE|nr:DUF1905 domain-containing protein [Microbacterium testaceum]KTS05479.1 hypothetical protein NS283_06370 [Microbacterium testaceum]KTS13195.1 hypothetical protein RSA3_05750 [Microbacterium testaceum]KTS66232.1 hypothetical protein NS206_02975 [Microbacterium testaceum]KTS85875.1 hypothetical protein NS183_11835 [Microbacterium testaceum]